MSRESNIKKIDAVFSRLMAVTPAVIESSMREALHDSAVYAIDIHNDEDLHKETPGHYAWGLQHGSQDLGGESYDGEDFVNDPFNELAGTAMDANDGTWEGVIVAQMGGRYKEKKEEGILADVAAHARRELPENIRKEFGRHRI